MSYDFISFLGYLKALKITVLCFQLFESLMHDLLPQFASDLANLIFLRRNWPRGFRIGVEIVRSTEFHAVLTYTSTIWERRSAGSEAPRLSKVEFAYCARLVQAGCCVFIPKSNTTFRIPVYLRVGLQSFLCKKVLHPSPIYFQCRAGVPLLCQKVLYPFQVYVWHRVGVWSVCQKLLHLLAYMFGLWWVFSFDTKSYYVSLVCIFSAGYCSVFMPKIITNFWYISLAQSGCFIFMYKIIK